MTDNTLPGAYARNTLVGAGLLEYHEPIVLNDTNLFSPSGSAFNPLPAQMTGTFSKAVINVYPNPAHDYFIIDYSDPTSEISGSYSIKILDSRGFLIQTYIRKKAVDQFLIRSSSLTPGIYFIELWNEQNRIAFTKLILSE